MTTGYHYWCAASAAAAAAAAAAALAAHYLCRTIIDVIATRATLAIEDIIDPRNRNVFISICLTHGVCVFCWRLAFRV